MTPTAHQPTLATHSFSEAKSHLSEVMSEVVREHSPALVERHGGKEAMVLLGREEAERLLAPFALSTTATVSEGEFVLRVPELGLIAGGETFPAALDELDTLVLEYARHYFARVHFYLQTDRAGHYPYLVRLALGDGEERRRMLVPMPDAVPSAR